jgi:hypothetical protein
LKIWILIAIVAYGTRSLNYYPARIYSTQALCEREMRDENAAAAAQDSADAQAYRCVSGPLMSHIYDPAKDSDADIDTSSLKDPTLGYLKRKPR